MRKAVLITLLILLAGCTTRQTTEPPLLLINGGFEEGWHLSTAFWTPEGGPIFDQHQEITPPEGWVAWWHEGFPSADGSLTRRPEVRVISAIPDAERVRSGEQAVQWFTFWGSHIGGLYQQVAVEDGHSYTFSIYAHSWFANCDLKPHYRLPLDYDCDTDDPILWAQDWLKVCIDPTGGMDPLGPAVVCGKAREIYGVYGEALTTGRVQAQGLMITVFVRSEASHPLKHDDFYIDDALLQDVTHRVFLPTVTKNTTGVAEKVREWIEWIRGG